MPLLSLSGVDGLPAGAGGRVDAEEDADVVKGVLDKLEQLEEMTLTVVPSDVTVDWEEVLTVDNVDTIPDVENWVDKEEVPADVE